MVFQSPLILRIKFFKYTTSLEYNQLKSKFQNKNNIKQFGRKEKKSNPFKLLVKKYNNRYNIRQWI